MKTFKVPDDKDIEERHIKGPKINYGRHVLQGLQTISVQLDELSNNVNFVIESISKHIKENPQSPLKLEQVLSLEDAENKQEIRKGCPLKAILSQVAAWIRK